MMIWVLSASVLHRMIVYNVYIIWPKKIKEITKKSHKINNFQKVSFVFNFLKKIEQKLNMLFINCFENFRSNSSIKW